MKIIRQISILLAATALTACGDAPQTHLPATRAATEPMYFASPVAQEAEMTKQSRALNAMTGKIVKASVKKGMKVGAVVGCGLVLVSPQNAKSCVSGAATGAAAGAIAGQRAGKRDVARRVEIVSANDLVRGLRKTNTQLDVIETNLPALLARQDEELAQLEWKHDAGLVAESVYNTRKAEIGAMRAQLAESLTLSEREARTAQQNLKAAAAQGQTGLDYHMAATGQIARDTASARSTITLF